jgi:hypothetical protein
MDEAGWCDLQNKSRVGGGSFSKTVFMSAVTVTTITATVINNTFYHTIPPHRIVNHGHGARGDRGFYARKHC